MILISQTLKKKMSIIQIDDERLKELFKTAFVEVFEQHRDLVHEAVTEAVEDIALTRAINEGAGSAPVSRDEVFAVLDGER